MVDITPKILEAASVAYTKDRDVEFYPAALAEALAAVAPLIEAQARGEIERLITIGAARIGELDVENQYLRAELAQARADAIEEAAKVADYHSEGYGAKHMRSNDDADFGGMIASDEIAASIRSLALSARPLSEKAEA